MSTRFCAETGTSWTGEILFSDSTGWWRSLLIYIWGLEEKVWNSAVVTKMQQLCFDCIHYWIKPGGLQSLHVAALDQNILCFLWDSTRSLWPLATGVSDLSPTLLSDHFTLLVLELHGFLEHQSFRENQINKHFWQNEAIFCPAGEWNAVPSVTFL